MYRVGQIVKLNDTFKKVDWYTSQFLRVSEIKDNGYTVVVDEYPCDWRNGEIYIDYIYDATEEYRQEIIKRLCEN